MVIATNVCKQMLQQNRLLAQTQMQYADQPAKNVVHLTVSMCCLCWTAVVQNHKFSKMCVYARGFVQGCRAHYVIQLLILWSWQRPFLHVCIHNTLIHSIFIIVHYMHMQTYVNTYVNICKYIYIYIYIYICTHTGNHCTQCVLGLAMVQA
jgi:hypothetical protein